jgi:hypothetical protein
VDQNELDRRWFSLEPIEGVKYGLNDAVRITYGEYVGGQGAVISLLSVSPVVYLIELSSVEDASIEESALELIEKHCP